MLPFTLLMLPAAVFQAPEPAMPPIVEVGHGVFILKGVPTAETYRELKRMHIAQVIDLRRDGDGLPPPDAENAALQEIGIAYTRYAITRTPPAGDLDFLRDILKALPRGDRILVHCTDGNRAGAALCPYLVLDRGVKLEEAIKVCRQGGMIYPETEAAVRQYLGAHGKS